MPILSTVLGIGGARFTECDKVKEVKRSLNSWWPIFPTNGNGEQQAWVGGDRHGSNLTKAGVAKGVVRVAFN